MVKNRLRITGLAGALSFVLTGMCVVALVLPFLDIDTPREDVVAGPVRVIDGDSLKVGGREVRLSGIDAPEYPQTCRLSGKAYGCGRRARNHLVAMIGGLRVRCDVIAEDRFGRALGECYADRVFLNEMMVLDGWAVGYRRFERQEKRAQRQRKGLWQGTFERPKAWRTKNNRDGTAKQ